MSSLHTYLCHIVMCSRVNSGFEEQLCMYEAIGCEVDFSCPLYKQYRLNKVAEKYPGRRTHTHMVWISYQCLFYITLIIIFAFFSLCSELEQVPRELFAVDPAHSSSSEVSYRCRKCRWQHRNVSCFYSGFNLCLTPPCLLCILQPNTVSSVQHSQPLVRRRSLSLCLQKVQQPQW